MRVIRFQRKGLARVANGAERGGSQQMAYSPQAPSSLGLAGILNSRLIHFAAFAPFALNPIQPGFGTAAAGLEAGDCGVWGTIC